MLTRAQYILSDPNIWNQLHEGTISFLQWAIDVRTSYSVSKRGYQVAGLFYRKHCVNVDEMEATSQFYSKAIDGLRDAYIAVKVANSNHTDLDSTLKYVHSIDRHIRYFVEINGGIDMLPFHPNQWLHFRVQPFGLYSKTATAIFYQNFRAGYFEGMDGSSINKDVGKDRFEHAYGIIESARKVSHGAYIRLIMPRADTLHKVIHRPQPTLVWHEQPGKDGIHEMPVAAEEHELQMDF